MWNWKYDLFQCLMLEKGCIWLSYYKVWQFSFAGFFDIFRVTKCNKVILLESVTDCYYKVRPVLQTVTDFITKCVRYYKYDSYYKVICNNIQPKKNSVKIESLKQKLVIFRQKGFRFSFFLTIKPISRKTMKIANSALV